MKVGGVESTGAIVVKFQVFDPEIPSKALPTLSVKAVLGISI